MLKFRGILSLAAVLGWGVLGCTRPLPVSPNVAIGRGPVGLDPSQRIGAGYGTQLPGTGTLRTIPRQTNVVVNPWKPAVAARDWKHIVIHHTASATGNVNSIHESHLKKKDKNGNHWMGIGYHFVIGNGNGMGDGEIESTFRWREQLHGAHAGANEYNQHGIGIALVGNFENAPPSPAQLAAVKRLVAVMKSEYGIGSNKVIGHKDVKATACPGKFFPIAEVSESR